MSDQEKFALLREWSLKVTDLEDELIDLIVKIEAWSGDALDADEFKLIENHYENAHYYLSQMGAAIRAIRHPIPQD